MADPPYVESAQLLLRFDVTKEDVAGETMKQELRSELADVLKVQQPAGGRVLGSLDQRGAGCHRSRPKGSSATKRQLAPAHHELCAMRARWRVSCAVSTTNSTSEAAEHIVRAPPAPSWRGFFYRTGHFCINRTTTQAAAPQRPPGAA